MSDAPCSFGAAGFLPFQFYAQAGAFDISRKKPTQPKAAASRLAITASGPTAPRRECPVLSGWRELNHTRFSARVNRIPTELETNS